MEQSNHCRCRHTTNEQAVSCQRPAQSAKGRVFYECSIDRPIYQRPQEKSRQTNYPNRPVYRRRRNDEPGQITYLGEQKRAHSVKEKPGREQQQDITCQRKKQSGREKARVCCKAIGCYQPDKKGNHDQYLAGVVDPAPATPDCQPVQASQKNNHP